MGMGNHGRHLAPDDKNYRLNQAFYMAEDLDARLSQARAQVERELHAFTLGETVAPNEEIAQNMREAQREKRREIERIRVEQWSVSLVLNRRQGCAEARDLAQIYRRHGW